MHISAKKFPTFLGELIPVCAQTDPEAFFPELGRGATPEAKIAKIICGECPVKDPCLEFALEHGDIGIWGGTTNDDRRRIRRERARSQVE